jgi:hypothetical protein
MKRYGDQICMKLAGPLRSVIEDDAAARERTISWVIRRVLIDHYAPRIAERADEAA